MPPSTDDLDAFGWDEETLRATLENSFGAGAGSDLPEEVRFLISVTRLIRNRLAKAGLEAETGLALFCLLPIMPDEDVGGLEEEVPMLDDGTSVIGDRLWRVGPTAASGVPVKLAEASDGTSFRKASAIGAGAVPTVVFKPAASVRELRYYPHGVGSPDDYRTIDIRGLPLSMVDVLDEVDRIYHGQLVTPDAQTTPAFTWKNKQRGWPVESAEKVVQHYLIVGLSSAFPQYRVVAEQPGIAGRPDIEIEDAKYIDGGIARHALLELKVLRSFHESGTKFPASKTKQWVKEGVEQAAMYRDERHTHASALCCFDMRKDVTGDDCFSHVAKLARAVDVTLRNWHLFSSAKSYREHSVAATTMAASG